MVHNGVLRRDRSVQLAYPGRELQVPQLRRTDADSHKYADRHGDPHLNAHLDPDQDRNAIQHTDVDIGTPHKHFNADSNTVQHADPDIYTPDKHSNADFYEHPDSHTNGDGPFYLYAYSDPSSHFDQYELHLSRFTGWLAPGIARNERRGRHAWHKRNEFPHGR